MEEDEEKEEGEIFPNLVDDSWLWWIMSVILANQKGRNILNEW